MNRFVSTGHLPPHELVPKLLSTAHELFDSNTEGANSQVYPALASVPSKLFGICVAGVSGTLYQAGDADFEFTLMSVSKPFVFALVCETLGPDRARDTLGVNATGLPFNSLTAIERSPDGRTNPMVNPGAIAAATLVPGESIEAKWRLIREGLSRFAGRSLSLDDEVYESASATNQRNQDIARLLQSHGRLA
jgi:glutaminase